MRDPCPYCGMPNIARSYIDGWTRHILRDIKDHPCPEWDNPMAFNPPPILPSDPGRGEPGGKEAMADYLAYVEGRL